MTAVRPDMLPDWPAAMRAELAAAYCGLSESAFRQHKTRPAPVRPTPKTVVWRRADLDRWLESLAKDPDAGEAFDWDSAKQEAAACRGGGA